jgi:hypothetical protein
MKRLFMKVQRRSKVDYVVVLLVLCTLVLVHIAYIDYSYSEDGIDKAWLATQVSIRQIMPMLVRAVWVRVPLHGGWGGELAWLCGCYCLGGGVLYCR